MTTYLGKSCSFSLPRVPFVNCRQFMYLAVSLLVLRAGCGIWLYQFLIIAYLFTFHEREAFHYASSHVNIHCGELFAKFNIKLYSENISALQYVHGIKVSYSSLPLSYHITSRTAHFTSTSAMLYPADRGSMYGALPWVWSNRGIKLFIPGERGNKDLQMSEHVNKGNFGGIKGNEDFYFGEQRNKATYFRGTREKVPGRASCMPWSLAPLYERSCNWRFNRRKQQVFYMVDFPGTENIL